jgi:hypothetical protein
MTDRARIWVWRLDGVLHRLKLPHGPVGTWADLCYIEREDWENNHIRDTKLNRWVSRLLN